MRTLIVATQIRLPDNHGGSTHVGELKRQLERYGPVLVLGKRGSTAPGVVGLGHGVKGPALLQRALARLQRRAALRAAQEFRPDVIYERGSSYGLGAQLSKALDVPMLCMVLDEHFSWASLERAQKVISTTADTVPAAARHKFVKVSWGANDELFHPDVPRIADDRLPPFDGLTLGYVGSFKAWHGLNDLVTVASRLSHHPLRFLLLGEGPERAPLIENVRRAGLEARFVFPGAVDYAEVPRWIAAMDVCVAPFHPSAHNASRDPRAGSPTSFILDPLKVFEYLAMGKPTITVDTPNLRALFTHGEHALLIQPGVTEALIAAIERTVSDLAAARLMAERGRELVRERHTWGAHAEHLHRLFQEMVTP